MFGADCTLPSSTIANCLPILLPVTFSNLLAPSEVRLKLTAGLPNSSELGFAVFKSRPVIEATLFKRYHSSVGLEDPSLKRRTEGNNSFPSGTTPPDWESAAS